MRKQRPWEVKSSIKSDSLIKRKYFVDPGPLRTRHSHWLIFQLPYLSFPAFAFPLIIPPNAGHSSQGSRCWSWKRWLWDDTLPCFSQGHIVPLWAPLPLWGIDSFLLPAKQLLCLPLTLQLPWSLFQTWGNVRASTDPMDCSRQAPPSMGFPRQEYWSRLPFPTPRDLLNPRTEPASLMSPALADRFFTINTTWEAPYPQ